MPIGGAMTDTTTTKICPGCKAEVAVEALRCPHCPEWLLRSVPLHPAAQASGPAPTPARSKPRWPKIVAIVLGVLVAGFLAIIILSVLAITVLGEKPESDFEPVGQPISAPPARDIPPPILSLD